MRREEAEKLLGGYAAGTLTAEERRALAEAALSDQRLFEALADEEALRALLADPGARARLREVVARRPPPWERAAAWVMRPAPMSALAGLAAVAIAVVVFAPRPEPPRELAAVRREAVAEISPAPVEPPARPVSPPAAERLAERFAAPPQTQPPAREPAEERRAEVGRDVAGGVIGGIPTAPAAAPPPPPPPEPMRMDAPAAAPAPRASLEGAADLGRARPPTPAAAATPATPAKSEIAPPVRYRLERLTEAGNYVTVAPASNFVEGESVRLIVEPLVEGWLLVQLRDGTTTRSLLATPVTPGLSYAAPAAGALPSGAGDRRLVIMLTPEAPGVGQTAFRAAPVAPGAAGIRQSAAPARPGEADAADVMKRSRSDDRLPLTIEIPLSYK
jgi:hypothetical protein